MVADAIWPGAELARENFFEGRYRAIFVSVHSNTVKALCFDTFSQVFILRDLLKLLGIGSYAAFFTDAVAISVGKPQGTGTRFCEMARGRHRKQMIYGE